ncbi:MAG: BRO family protein [Methylococcales bacterium]
MNNALSLLENSFEYSEKPIRTALDDRGIAWFCAKDIFEALGLVWKGRGGSLKNYPEKWLMVWYLQTIQGEKAAIFMSEPGVYQTILSSNKPEAVVFRDWIFEEVIPAIRKTGGYGASKSVDLLACHKAIHVFLDELLRTKSVVKREMLTASLKALCNVAGLKMPDINRLPLKIDQTDLFEGGVQ